MGFIARVFYTRLSKEIMAKVCLIAESDPFIARLLQRFAEKSGFQTILLQVGPEVLESVQHARPDVIIIEPELPGKMRGWDVIQHLKAGPVTRLIPIITCSRLKETEVSKLVGELQGNLQPEHTYADFVHTFAHAGIDV
jgi:CheY-like chemotaxis protein